MKGPILSFAASFTKENVVSPRSCFLRFRLFNTQEIKSDVGKVRASRRGGAEPVGMRPEPRAAGGKLGVTDGIDPAAPPDTQSPERECPALQIN